MQTASAEIGKRMSPLTFKHKMAWAQAIRCDPITEKSVDRVTDEDKRCMHYVIKRNKALHTAIGIHMHKLTALIRVVLGQLVRLKLKASLDRHNFPTTTAKAGAERRTKGRHGNDREGE